MAILKFLPIALLLAVVHAVPARNLRTTLRQTARITLGICKSSSNCVDRDVIGLKCVKGTCTPRTLGKVCLTSADCSTFTACSSNTCEWGTGGAICKMWRQCAPGFSCQQSVCKRGIDGATCDMPYNCEKGLTCRKLKCVPGIAKSPCRTNNDCLSGICRFSISGRFATGICTAPLSTPPPAPAKSAAPSTPPPPTPAAPSTPAPPKPSGPANEPATSKQPEAVKNSTNSASSSEVASQNGTAIPVTPITDAANSGNTTSPGSTDTVASTTSSETQSVEPGTATATSEPITPNVEGSGSTNSPNSSRASPTPAPARICIGSSSHRAGVSLHGLLRPVHRMQMHPLRLFSTSKRVAMHCFTSSGSRLCASASHIVEHKGKLMYMADFCAGHRCTIDMEIPLNFKGFCGEHIEFIEGLKATQHAAVDTMESAAFVARQECALRASNRALWTVRTL